VLVFEVSETGRVLPLGQLPAAPSYGAMAFADGWRAVVDTELRGPMASFDAGATWRPLAIKERVTGAAVRDDDPVLYVDGGYYLLDASGHVQLVRTDDESTNEEPADESEEEEVEREQHPLGDRPLRVAVEHGFPDTPSSVVVVHRGSLVRMSLPDGIVRGLRPDAVDSEQASCQGARVGRGFGFVCGEPAGPTVVYAFQQPLSLREVARFDEPRFVSASDNGALVVRGGCGSAASAARDVRHYCVLGVDGKRREIAVRGELGAERVVALADGRTVVLVPPRPERAGRITIIDGVKLESKVLKDPGGSRAAVKIAQRGMWLEGFEQRAPDTIGGWVEAGGPVVGVTVKLDGSVTVGKLNDHSGDALMGGRFALLTNETGGALETTDGGRTWSTLELPVLAQDSGAKTRACTAVGCALRGWVRIGWGPTAVKNDLTSAEAPEGRHVKPLARTPMRLTCDIAKSPSENASGGDAASTSSNWSAFRGMPPPRLGSDEEKVQKTSERYEEVPLHVYVWGPKGADWTRAGWWVMRFEDRFDPVNGIRESARTRSLWTDELSAADALGARHRTGYWTWTASLDPSGRAALATACQGARCIPYAIAEGRPIVPLREASSTSSSSLMRKQLDHGVARLGDTWYFLTESQNVEITLWRAELGVVRELGHYQRFAQRPDGGRFQGSPKTPLLVRRALGAELGLLIEVPADPASGSEIGRWVVLPINTETGALGEPVNLGSADLDGKVPPRCGAEDDGWLVDAAPSAKPFVEVPGRNNFVSDVEMRLRMDPGYVCVASLSARASHGFRVEDSKNGGEGASIPMVARENMSVKPWRLACRASPPGSASPPAAVRIEPPVEESDEDD
jgi:hypothetical protein